MQKRILKIEVELFVEYEYDEVEYDEVHEIRRKNMRQLTIPQSFGLSYSR